MKQVCLYVYGTIEIPWNDAPKKTLTVASRELKTDFDLNTIFSWKVTSSGLVFMFFDGLATPLQVGTVV